MSSNEEKFLLEGEVGEIEAVLTSPTENIRASTAIICHPHPLYGGTMNNKVVTTLARTFQEMGLKTLRFNFRGVGLSEGQHDEGKGEIKDVLKLANWVKALAPEDTLWLAGFSFGAYVATMAATILKPQQLICIAPQVSRFLSEPLFEVTCPWILVQGEKDEVVSPEEVFAWVETLDTPPQVIRFPEAGHFFHGQLGELRQKIQEVLASQ